MASKVDWIMTNLKTEAVVTHQFYENLSDHFALLLKI